MGLPWKLAAQCIEGVAVAIVDVSPVAVAQLNTTDYGGP